MAPRPVLLVGLAGGTASGKTTICHDLSGRWPEMLCIAHDRYYHTVPDPSRHNYDHPSALDSGLLCEHLDRLIAGESAELPEYDFATHRRRAETERVEPAQVVLVEGILVLADARLARRFHLKVYVHAPDDVRLMRRIRRDAVERARSVQSVLHQYESTVRPSHLRYVAPCRAVADLVLDGEAPIDEEAARLEQAIRARL
ncbi:MAG: uridine kinase [Pseudomonadota bacterium]